MAYKNKSRVQLGYEDEYISEKHRSVINFATNKIGGKPDPHKTEGSLPAPVCKLCGLNQLLVVQIYAPLDNSKYHRTLYIFTCINPNCWNQNESWTCLRVQSLEEKSINETAIQSSVTPPTTSWLSQADDWGDDSNVCETNGNNMLMNDTTDNLHLFMSTSNDDTLNDELSNLRVDDPNANSPASVESPVGGAVGRLDSPQTSAEIEGEEGEVVSIDTPTQPQCNLMELFHGATPHPLQHSDIEAPIDLSFVEMFIAVEEEDLSPEINQHVRDLVLQYQSRNPTDLFNDTESNPQANDNRGMEEKYEKSIPKHGDDMFYNFDSRIKRNPGQILRYCRDNSAALLLYPLGSKIEPCKYCGAERIFELQILSTIIPKLKLVPCRERDFEIDFGTVLIFTCSASCWSANDTYKEEYVIVQAERL
ncbi:programmed cell death protein 2-like [Microplitis demolitor]|uniref:programmed cell death protein 2-like n=1 Tax=Microplitis demolitor TaxID=69319 RepID=UPI0004CD3344|nr:programmed cell death protein 2-like [Microplitis demolitor]XP_014298618.1 programmed cell death protein 2-like [Microplitis demolitor]